MKINKSFLSRIIKEEIKKVLYEEDPPWARKAVDLFINISTEIKTKNPDQKTKIKYLNLIKKVTGQRPETVFKYLNGKVDNDLYTNLAQLLNGEVSTNLFADFDDNITPASYKTTDPKRTPMDDVRPPKIEPQKQEDPRHKKKNLVH